MKTIGIVALSLLSLVPVLALQAKDEDLKKHAGYVDLKAIQIPDKAGKVTEVFLGPAMLKIAAMVEGGDDDKDVSRALSGLQGIQVKSFEVGESDAGSIIPIMDKIEKDLNRQGWERLVLVKEEDERVVVSIKSEGGTAVGLMVMAFEPGEEATFVNIIGTIDLEMLGGLNLDLDDSVLDSLKRHSSGE